MMSRVSSLASCWLKGGSNGGAGQAVDLMNDYCGQQLFVVDGDSLLEFLLHRERIYSPLDVRIGPHPVHVAFVFETFLANLVRARANFHLVWFDDRSHLSALATRRGGDTLTDVELAARCYIRTMLKTHVAARCADVAQHSFSAIDSPGWTSYVRSKSPYFVLLHDGLYAAGNQSPLGQIAPNGDRETLPHDGQQAASNCDDDDLVAAAQTCAIYAHLKGDGEAKGSRPPLSIALIREGMFVDNKVRTFVIEASIKIRHECIQARSQAAFSHLRAQVDAATTAVATLLSQLGIAPSLGHEDGTQLDSCPAQLEHIALQVAKTIDLDCRATPVVAQAVLLHAAVGQTLDVEDRVSAADAVGELGAVCGDTAVRRGLVLLYCASERALSALSQPSASDRPLLLVDPCLFLVIAAMCSESEELPACTPTIEAGLVCFQRLCASAGIAATLPDARRGPALRDHEGPSETRLLPYNHDFLGPKLPQLGGSAANESHAMRGTVDFGGIAYEDLFQQRSDLTLGTQRAHITVDPAKLQGLTPYERERYIKYREMRELRKQQGLAAWLHSYAASLTGANGGILEKQTITVGQARTKVKQQQQQHHHHHTQHSDPTAKETKAASKNKPAKLSKKDAIIAANKAAKAHKDHDRSQSKWAHFVQEKDLGPALSKVDGGEVAASAGKLLQRREQLSEELRRRLVHGKHDRRDTLLTWLLVLRLALESWLVSCATASKEAGIKHAVDVFVACQKVTDQLPASLDCSEPNIDLAAAFSIWTALAALGLEEVLKQRLGPAWDVIRDLTEQQGRRGDVDKLMAQLPFDMPLPKRRKRTSLPPHLGPARFQLLHCGDFMERQLDSAADARVTFLPDRWQREVLDEIDAGSSILVVAPTSAGKTFSSFYAMEKVLRQDDEGAVIYVAPTKALVNQIAAEIEARFAKAYAGVGRTLYSICTADYSLNNPFKSQILITVPEMLDVLLLRDSATGNLVPRIRRIILDEVHVLSESCRGSIYEQLIVMCPAPIIALSATIGNVDDFGSWLATVSAAHGHRLAVVQHKTRYSDLVKHVYVPRAPFDEFRGVDVGEARSSGGGGSDASEDDDDGGRGGRLRHLHPWTALIQGNAQLVDDLEMSPAEMVQAYDAMRSDTLAFQARLRQQLETWMDRPDARSKASPFLRLLASLDGGLVESVLEYDLERPFGNKHRDFWNQALLQLLTDMDGSGLLPGLFFNYDRNVVESMVETVVGALVEAEQEYKESDQWRAELERLERAQKEHDAARKRLDRDLARAKEGSSARTRAEEALDRFLSANPPPMAGFDPEGVLPRFSFASFKKALADDEIQGELAAIEGSVAPHLVEGLRRGVAAHHAGLSNKYRQLVERWYRMGRIRVCFCTGSLALGINMPAVSSVFIGHSMFLTAVQYRQAAGRAGRRGLDLRGNVVFFGVHIDRVHRLLTSKVPELQGSFPLSTTLVLRLHMMLHRPDTVATAQSMASAVLCLSRMSMARSDAPRVQHQMRASIEYLRRIGLLDERGRPVDLAGLVSRLHYAEPSNFAFAALLRDGFFYRLCQRHRGGDLKYAGRELMLVLCHLFCRIERLPGEGMYDVVRGSPSKVFLEPMPDEAAQILARHSRHATDTYRDFVVALAQREGPKLPRDDSLPLSGRLVGGGDSVGDDDGSRDDSITRSDTAGMASGGPTEPAATSAPSSGSWDASTVPTSPATTTVSSAPAPATTRSVFWQLLSLGDQYESVGEISQSLQPGLSLTAEAIPSFDVFLRHRRGDDGDGDEQPTLNAYLLDFYKHGIAAELVRANGLRRGDVWVKLDDFYRVLCALRASIETLLRSMIAAKERASAAVGRSGVSRGRGRDAAKAEASSDWEGHDESESDEARSVAHGRRAIGSSGDDDEQQPSAGLDPAPTDDESDDDDDVDGGDHQGAAQAAATTTTTSTEPHHGGAQKKRRVPSIPPLIALDAEQRDADLWEFYVLLDHVQRQFGRRFFAIFS
ncbi:uncharacterized protein PFL1_06800 [Pseudozyma flocculosa PF-1]|uniref:DEAD/DEAH box helicase n=2 Tax=Pseudozyma flocculosa TaxID=84751 RepID=A0A5C3FCD7_9BASI|nr:uncharacterized protein PFL1_06800 [Pseudozyma flocculosa PF-1]EPQ25663.1 hypothetical protein PFL1_06800 [Pseudozyma flocculosa PF-1]SPO42072.1 uncharacterized protein PSFLO_07555 [Pseudozyma flocculosa]